MRSTRRGPVPALVFAGALLILHACGDESHAPPARTETPPEQLRTDEPGNLAPIDLVYVCGNKFLATNSHRRSVHLTWRVLGTTETGSITLPPGREGMAIIRAGRLRKFSSQTIGRSIPLKRWSRPLE